MNTLKLFLISVVLLACWSRVSAQDANPPQSRPLILTDDQDEYPLGLYLEILEDPGGELTIEEVDSPELESQFIPSTDEVPNFGFTNNVYWVRLKVENESQMNDSWFLEHGFANTHFVDLYTPLPGGTGFAVKRTGVLRAPSSRDVIYPTVVFNLSIPTEAQHLYYLRFESGASMTLPLTLWKEAAFLVHVSEEQIFYGLFYGVLIGLLLFNLFLLLYLREVNYLFFVLLLALFILEEASYDGLLALYVIPNLDFLKSNSQQWTFTLLIMAAILFSDSFLDLKTRIPLFHWINLGILSVGGVFLLIAPFVRYYSIAIFVAPWAVFSLVIIFISGMASWLRGYLPARFFMIAWFGMIISITWVLLIRLGYVSSTLVGENSYRVGAMWMAVFWSFALADRFNLLKTDLEDANRDLRSSERRLSQILEGLPLGVTVYGTDYKPSYINRRVYKILGNPVRGVEPDISAGRTLTEALDYFSLKEADSDQAYPIEKLPVHQALGGQPAHVDDVEADLVDRRVPLEIWATPVEDGEGKVEAAVVAFQDITERKQSETELAEYRKRLEQLVEERTEELSSTNELLGNEIIEREKLEQILQQHIRWLTALGKVRQSLGGTGDLQHSYEELSDSILGLLRASEVYILQWGTVGTAIEVDYRQQQDGTVSGLSSIRSILQADPSLREEIEKGNSVHLSSAGTGTMPEAIEALFQQDGIQALLLHPLDTRWGVAGLLAVALGQPLQHLTSAEFELFESIAQDMADLADDARLLDQARALIAAEERTRLARDLHDSVTQVLFSASLVAEVLPRIWERDPERAFESLEELRRLTRAALAEMRTMLLELRPAAVIKTPLAELLSQLTEAVTSRGEVKFQLLVEQVPPLPDEVHASFYRIAQEALNNVVKHAQAGQVNVTLKAGLLTPAAATASRWMADPVGHHLMWAKSTAADLAGTEIGQVELVIEDDGVGFSPEIGQEKHLGLGIMQERADAIQAILNINSRPGGGTIVALSWSGPIKNER